MRFPSLSVLAERATFVLRRFPWTLLMGAIAAIAAIDASGTGEHDLSTRIAFVAALGIPATLAIALLGAGRGWSRARQLAAPGAAVAALGLFFAVWPGVEFRHEAMRYVQLSAALHLAVAFLPFTGATESIAFWQYNRRLFLGFLRAGVFSAVLFVGITIALGALDHLFGVDVPERAYVRIWFVVALLGNTWIFLSVVPERLAELDHDTEYPRALKVFTQYILTPLAFTYLVILLAYLVKLIFGATWPSGWIGWLVASVAVTGLLGFLLVHPLRAAEPWIRTYARWLFVGLIPAAVMLLVAFWKRIVPYGLTEPRVLGIVLGLWLLAIALTYTLRPGTSIRTIPVSLSALLLATLYGPVSLSQLSVTSQARRLRAALAANDRQADAALRFLLDHRATGAIAGAIGKPLPRIAWDSVSRYGEGRDSVAGAIMALAGRRYQPEYLTDGGAFYLRSDYDGPVAITGFDWAMRITSTDTMARVVGADTLRVAFDSVTNVARIRHGADTIVFDLGLLAGTVADSISRRGVLPQSHARVSARPPGRGALALTNFSGRRSGDSTYVTGWGGWLLIGGR